MKKYALWAVYGVMFLLFLFKMFYYREELYYVPDEDAHISYLAYVQENPDKLIPEYDDIKLCRDRTEAGDGICRYTIGNTVCALKNPPLYYRAMQLVGGVVTQETEEGHFVYMNVERLKTANIYLTAFAMMLMLYISYTRLGCLTQSVLCHALAALAMTSVGEYAKYGSCIMNSNLTNLGTVLLVWGILQIVEKRGSLESGLLTAAGLLVTFASGLSLRGYLPFLALAVIAGAVWLTVFQSYRLWHILGYKAKARRLKKESTNRAVKPELPAVLPCILALLMLTGGFTFEVMADAGSSAYDSIYELNQKYQMKKQGCLVLYADTGENAGDIEEAGYLMQGREIEQEFEVTEEMLAYNQLAIGLKIGTYGRKNDTPLYVEINQNSGYGKAYRVDCARIKDGGYVEIAFATDGMQQENACIKIYGDTKNGNQAVTVYTTKNCLLASEMKIAGASRDRNLVMRVYTPKKAEAVEQVVSH